MQSNDRIKFGKDPNVYIIEINNYLEEENTIQYPSMIKDDKISLVSEEFYSKATRNHFEKKDKPIVNNVNYIPVEVKKVTSITKQQTLNQNNNLVNGTDSPKFNNSIKEEDIPNNNSNVNNPDLNVTFKNSKSKEKDTERKTKLYEELYLKIEKLTHDNENLSKKNYELEEKLLEKNNEIKKMSNDIEHMTEEYSKLIAKHNALLIYASDIQKKCDLMEIEISEKKEEIAKYQQSDWGKLLLERDVMIKALGNDISYYKGEIAKIKANLLSNQPQYANDLTKRIDSLLDSYLQENKKYKKIVILLYIILVRRI